MSAPSGANAPYKIVKRGTKFAVVNNAGLTKATFDDENKARAYQKALYANVPGASKRADKMPWTGKTSDRVKAAFDAAVHSLGLRQGAAESVYMLRPHGFVYPPGMPPCSICGEGANAGPHINPSKSGIGTPFGDNWGRMMRTEAAAQPMRSPRKTHTYTSGGVGMVSGLPCAACKQPMSASAHTPGMPVGATDHLGVGVSVSQPFHQRAAQGEPGYSGNAGAGTLDDPSAGNIVMVRHKFEVMDGQSTVGEDYKMCRLCGFPQDDAIHELDADGQAQLPTVVVKTLPRNAAEEEAQRTLRTDVDSLGTRQLAFVTQLGGKVILSAPAEVFSNPESLPREIAAEWESISSRNPHFMWLKGAYVEANKPNRNQAMWTADDLEFGTPSVSHGPINMLHVERHIIGTLPAAQLVQPTREAAAEGETNTIHALGAIWKYLFPQEARQIATASADKKLWYSMECVSREVACQAPGCTHTQSYRDYMLAKHERCPHIKDGAPRRFVDPIFDGAGIIIPPVRPGWANANASIMRQAAMLAERQESALVGLSEEEAVSMVAQIIEYAGGAA